MTTPRPSLLQAAKTYIAKSTEVAAVIVPLAMAAVPTETEAQVVFGAMTSTSAEFSGPSGGGSGTYTALSWFTKSLPEQNGFAGLQFGANYTLADLPAAGSGIKATIEFRSNSGSAGSLPKFSLVPFAYQFSLSASEGITLEYWSIDNILHGEDGLDAEAEVGAGSDFTSGIISGTSSLEVDYGYGDVYDPLILLDDAWVVRLTLYFSAAATTDWISVTMGESEGFVLGSNTFSAVPEPSTCAVWIGFAAVGFAAFRRRRAA